MTHNAILYTFLSVHPFKISFLSKGAKSLKHFSNACSTACAATPLQTGFACRDRVARRFAHSGKPFVNCIRPLIISLNTLHSPLNDDARSCTLIDLSRRTSNLSNLRTPYLGTRMLLALRDIQLRSTRIVGVDLHEHTTLNKVRNTFSIGTRAHLPIRGLLLSETLYCL